MQMMTITCAFCGAQTDKPAKSVKWAKSKGQIKFYCGLACMQAGRARGRIRSGTALRNLLCRYKQTARRRKVSFGLSDSEFASLVAQPCRYCGSMPEQVARAKSGAILKYNGVDRVDNSFGYLFTNCVSCCGVCNRWKSSLPLHAFLAHAERIVKCCQNSSS